MQVEFSMEEAQAALTTYLRDHVIRASKLKSTGLEVRRDAIGSRLVLTFEWQEADKEVVP